MFRAVVKSRGGAVDAAVRVMRDVGVMRGLRHRSVIDRPSQQIRSISIFPFQTAVDNAKAKVEAAPTEENTLNYLKALNNQDPKYVISTIEKGWSSGHIPVKEGFIREYVKAAAKLNKLESINISNLLALMANAKSRDGAAKLTDAEVSEILRKAISGTSQGNSNSNGGYGGGFSAGRSPDEPLHVVNRFSWKETAMKLAGTAVLYFLVLSFVMGSLDDSKSAPGGGGGIAGRLGMGGSIIKRAENPDKTFEDVVGIDEAKGDLQEIVMYLKDPSKFTRLGGRLPKGILLTGPPGTGKTLLARAIAGEAKVPFFHASGSEFEEMFVGVGAKRVRELFAAAKEKSPSIIFIDEIDAIGGKREMKDSGALKMTLNQLLVEMDGFDQNNGVIVIAATNFPDSLDKALIRPGRFDKHVDVPLPDIGGRKAILELYGKKVPMEKDVDYEQLARGTPGFSGAELYNLVNQAALRASIDNLNKVGMSALEWAKDKIMMGAERKSAMISPETMRMTAFHEAGHALVALKTAGADPIHKATIMPRGRALGMVMQLPDGDQTSISRKQMLARLDVCMGGRVAEELVFGHDNVTSGASSDIQQATRLAQAMVTQYGLSEKVGVIFINPNDKQSGDTQKNVDEEVKELLTSSYARAKNLLETHRKELDIVAQGLMQYESLAGGEIVDLINGKPLGSGVRSQKPSRPTKALPPSRQVVTNHMEAVSPNSQQNVTNSTGTASAVTAGASNKETTADASNVKSSKK